MSRSNPTLQNPAEHFFSWKGSEGKLVWYNKEEQKEVQVKLPFTFMVVDELATMTGYSDQDQSRYWSNEVRSIANEEFTVKTGKGTKQVGLYKDLADVRAKGAKYAKSIYLVHKIGERYALGNFKASGAALTAWIELSQKHRVGDGTVTLTGAEEQKKGATTYYVPTFEYRESTAEEDNIARELDKGLQVYLSQYLVAAQQDRASREDIMVDEIDPAVGQASPEEIADYNERVKNMATPDKKRTDAKKDDVVIEDIDDKPIDLSEIPF